MENKLLDQPFLDTLPQFAQFEGVADADNYRPLPDDWSLATADIVDSTKAIATGGYKSVNMAGASVISALLNALDRRDLPFVFGGDGALVAFPATATATVREALSAVQAWVADELELTMRAAIVPVADIRARGLDVRVARFQASGEVSYAMFTGGGASWAEAEMKAGRFTVEPAPAGTRPDLAGLSCRWNPIEARHGEIVSIIAVPGPAGSGKAFQQLVADIVALVGEEERGGHPVPPEGPGFSFPPKGLEAEARALAPKGKRFWPKLMILGQTALIGILSKLRLSLGRFDPLQYRSDVVRNSDFRKFDDGLKMTVDLDRERLRRIEERLERAEREGICSYGLHRQDSALMTCIVATPLQRDHIHFVDGAAGGYAMAANTLKAKAAA
ncbi:DUF3095 domain-containing protein [Allomesorhizobium camelthorni]|uniref:DUF3095 domain-containing protein n=1 Tax=Allomesorhizobium camelthorni TaxID=475069 RepID=A0A6G4WEG3_9HYPH|nr:DUF3095 domain-containing protein [Mesorhizobium camelthorni]NGO52583.1 DUF3095 domain-containing protein [Mesorhizobium camelthorni]